MYDLYVVKVFDFMSGLLDIGVDVWFIVLGVEIDCLVVFFG